MSDNVHEISAEITTYWESAGCTRRCWVMFHHTMGEHATNCPLAHIKETTNVYSWDSLPDLREDTEYAVNEIIPCEDFKGEIRVHYTYIPSEDEI